jgi:hypothetical protein
MAAPATKQEPIVPPKTLSELPSGLKEPVPSTKRCITERMNAVMKDVRGVGKNSHNPQGGYRYAGHEAVTDALRDAYVKHGIVRTATVLDTQILERGTLLLKVRVTWTCADDPHSKYDVEMPGLQSSVKKDGGMAPVQVGMALSYAVKNAEFKCFSLTGDDTPDTEAADDDRGEPSHEESHEPSEAETAAMAYLARFTQVKTPTELKVLNDEIRENWNLVKTVRDFSERMVAARRRTAERLRKGDRQPGED